MFKKKAKEVKQIELSDNVQTKYVFNYTLSYNEAYESFFILASKWSKKWKMIAGILLTMIAVIMLVLRFFEETGIHYTFIALMAILLLFYLIYAPMIKAKRGAKAVVKAKGHYKIEITAKGNMNIPNDQVVNLSNDKDARAIETATIFAVRPDGMHTFCIPKRIMTTEEEEGIREILQAYLSYQFR